MTDLEPPTGTAARGFVSGRELEQSAMSGAHALSTAHSYHHRQLRSQGGPDTPDNLILLLGTGTTGEHGWVHHNRRTAQHLGLVVPSWGASSEMPVFRRDPFGLGWDWFLQSPDGQLEWFGNARHRVAAIHGVESTDVDEAVAAYYEQVSIVRGGGWS